MDREQVAGAEALAAGRLVDGVDHGVDVGDDLRGLGTDAAAGAALGLGAGQGAHVGLHVFDAGGGDGFGPQQQAAEALQLGSHRAVQLGDGLLGVGDEAEQSGGDLGQVAAAGDRIGDEGAVAAGAAVPRGRVAGRIRPPDMLDQPSAHISLLSVAGMTKGCGSTLS